MSQVLGSPSISLRGYINECDADIDSDRHIPMHHMTVSSPKLIKEDHTPEKHVIHSQLTNTIA